MNDTLGAGFADPVRDSQAAFRAILNAMARPGRIERVTAPENAPLPFDRATAAVLLTLVDAETPLWLDAASDSARAWLAFHCGARFSPIDRAHFGVMLSRFSLCNFAPGTHEEPETSATVVMQVPALTEGVAYHLTGPGLASVSRLAVQGFPEDFQAQWELNRSLFPGGVDLILCAGDALAALPRTVKLEAL